MKENIEETWQMLRDRLKSFVLNKIKDEYIAEDILQDVFIKIHSKVDGLKDDAKIQSWIFQITRNTVIDYIRSTHYSKLAVPLHEEEDELISSELMEETLQDMVRMMADLPAEDCEALCLTELGKMSQLEYARKIGISYSGAKSRIQRAKKKLKDQLMMCCHYEFDKYGTVIGVHPAKCCCCS